MKYKLKTPDLHQILEDFKRMNGIGIKSVSVMPRQYFYFRAMIHPTKVYKNPFCVTKLIINNIAVKILKVDK